MHHETNVAHVINTIAAEVNMVLNKRQKEQYFDKVVLLYSFIENLLKWIVYIDIVWQQTKRYHKSNILVTEEEEKDIRRFCKRLRFYDAQTLALALGRIDYKLYKRVDGVREERNDVIHQLWVYQHRQNRAIIRKKLEKLAHVANDLVGACNKFRKEVRTDQIWKIF